MNGKILIVEDEASLRDTLKLNLELEDFETDTCSDGSETLDKCISFKPDLILMDIMMPKMDGMEVLKTLRAHNIQSPVIFLTAKNTTQDKIEGLKLGAEDYITKPFDLEELLLRINNVLKRNKILNNSSDTYKFDSCSINFSTFEVKTINQTIDTLSKREMALLKILTDNENTVVSRDEILNKLWNKDENPSSRTIDNYILNFRKLFEKNPKEPVHFHSIRGVGYKFTA